MVTVPTSFVLGHHGSVLLKPESDDSFMDKQSNLQERSVSWPEWFLHMCVTLLVGFHLYFLSVRRNSRPIFFSLVG